MPCRGWWKGLGIPMSGDRVDRLLLGFGRRILPIMFFLILLTSLCGITSTFIDLTFQRQWILHVLADVQAQLLQGSTLLDANGALSPQAKAWVDQLETLSQRGLDLNAVEFLFGAFTLALVTVSAFLLERSHENVTASEARVEGVHKRVADLEPRVLRIEGMDIGAYEKRIETLEGKLSRLERAATQLERINQDVVELRSTVSASTRTSVIISQASVASFHTSLLAATSDPDARLANAPLIRDSLTLVQHALQEFARDEARMDPWARAIATDLLTETCRDLENQPTGVKPAPSDLSRRCQSCLELLQSMR